MAKTGTRKSRKRILDVDHEERNGQSTICSDAQKERGEWIAVLEGGERKVCGWERQM